MNKIFLISSFLFLISFYPPKAQARIIITEVYPNPTTGESEWLELYNDATTSADLTDWILEDQLSTPSIIYNFNDSDLETFKLASYQYLVIELPTSKLNNSADGVTLIDQTGQIIDEMSYSSSTQGQSWSLINGDWYLTEPTSEQENQPPPSVTPSPSPSPSPSIHYDQLADDLSFSEVYYCPSSGDNEWLELKNDSDQLVDLSSWQLIDQSGNKKTLSQSINPNSLAVIDWSSSFLNNSGDTLALHSPEGVEQLKISLPECSTGLSLIYHDSSWRLTTSPTPGDENIFTSTDEETPDDQNNNEQKEQLISDSDQSQNENQLSTTNSHNEFEINYPPDRIKLESFLSSESGQVLGTIDFAPNQPNYDQLKYATLCLLIGGGIWTGVGAIGFKYEYQKIHHSELD